MPDVSDYVTNLEQARLQVSQRLRQITADPNPNYNINGQNISWTDYQKMLLDSLKALNKAIAEGEADSTPWEEVIHGF
jgi:hypothetical protein